jgi:hypothetical protein
VKATLALEDKVADTRRKVRSRGEAEELLDELEESGLALRAFCSERGLDGRSLQCWRLNLGRKPSASVTVGPPSLRLVEFALPSARASYRVLVGEHAVEVDDAFREDTLARLLDVLEARC